MPKDTKAPAPKKTAEPKKAAPKKPQSEKALQRKAARKERRKENKKIKPLPMKFAVGLKKGHGIAKRKQSVRPSKLKNV